MADSVSVSLASAGGGAGDGSPSDSRSVRASVKDAAAMTRALLGLAADDDYRPGCVRDEPPDVKTSTRAFEYMLRGKAPAPWRPEFFVDYCERELNAEGANFWFEVEALRRACDGLEGGDRDHVEPAVPEQFLKSGAEDRAQLETWAAAVVRLYVAEGAPYQINISSELRDATVKRASAFAEHRAAAFDEAQREMCKLMHQDVFPRFARLAFTTNLSANESRRRQRVAAAMILVLLLGQALFLGFFVPRGYLVLYLPLWYWALHKMWSAHVRLCVQGAMLGIRFIGDAVLPLECPITRSFNRKRAAVLMVKVASLASLLTLLPILITFIVDAALGRVVYG